MPHSTQPKLYKTIKEHIRPALSAIVKGRCQKPYGGGGAAEAGRAGGSGAGASGQVQESTCEVGHGS